MKPATWRSGFRIGLILLALAGAVLEGCRPREAGPTRLDPDKPAEIILRPGQTHLYSFAISQGDLISLVVEQRGIDLVLRLQHPDGREWLVIDSPIRERGTVKAFAVAQQTGEARLVLTSDSALEPGQYRLTLVSPHRPSQREKELAEASFILADVAHLRQSGSHQEDALKRGYRALELAEGLRDLELQALAHESLGQTLALQGRQGEALQHYEAARSGFGRLGNWSVFADLCRRIAKSQFALGEVQKARDEADQARKLHGNGRGRVAEADVAAALNDLALYERNLGEIGKAINAYEQSLSRYRALGSIDDQVKILNNLAILYAGVGDVEKVRGCMDEVQDLLAESGSKNPAEQARSLMSLGAALDGIGKIAELEPELRKAVDLCRQAKESNCEAGARLLLARALMSGGHLAEARLHLRQAEILARYTGRIHTKLQVMANQGILLNLEGKGQEALPLLDKAFRNFRNMADLDRAALVLYEKAKVEKQAGDLAAATASIQEALALEDGLRHNVLDRSLRVSFAAARRTHSDFLIDLLMERFHQEGDPALMAQAFEVRERSQAQTLLEDLVEGQRQASRPMTIDPQESKIAAELQELTLQWQVLQGEGEESESESRVQEALALEREIRHKLDQETRIRTARLAADPRLPWRHALNLPETQREVLDADKVLLVYHLGLYRSYLWGVTSSSIRGYDLPPRGEIEALVQRARRYFDRELPWTDREIQPILKRLSQILIEPAQASLSGKTLLISPEGALLRLPFAALPVPAASGGYHPLSDDHTILTVPSASVQASLQRRHVDRSPPSGVIAVLADPVFTRDDERVEDSGGFLGSRSAGRFLTNFGFRRGTTRNLLNLRALPYSRNEAESILALAPAGPRRLALGFDATVDLVRSRDLRNYRFIHLATHGVLHSQPDLSSLVLSQVDRSGRDLNGILPAYQIAQLDLPVEMVALSACETGLVEEKGKEEVSGLTRAFLYAGARRVVASLWKVDDLATEELMTRFYRAIWKDGLRPAEALRQAQKEMRQTPWSDPPYWAGFIIVGEE